MGPGKNGWTPERVFPQSAAWTAEIERLGHPPFDYGVQVLRSLGGLRFREYHPRSYQKLVQGWRERGLPPERWPKAADIRRKCEASLSALQRLGLDPDRYNGATFTFDALDAARDEEVVLDLGLAQKAIGKPLEACVTVEFGEDAFRYFSGNFTEEALADLCIVSKLHLVSGEGLSESAENRDGAKVTVARAEGEKCERCWKYIGSVGSNAKHPTLCARCASVVG